ncbi:MAG: polysaccharide deacetylase family protein [Desulfurococcales archaeon]|nr:polysaccharide deacetylase family protein [Desulfurococcales archaeon]
MTVGKQFITKCRLKGVVFLTFDVEPDAPPYQTNSYKGVEKGLPWILDLLDDEDVQATFFTVADLAEKHPDRIKEIVKRGHELASHGYGHVRLDKLSRQEAVSNIRKSVSILSHLSIIKSFRAPNLQPPPITPSDYTSLGITVDSSIAAYKKGRPKHPFAWDSLIVVPATSTSSTIRLPRTLALKYTLPSNRDFHALFYHPWEFVEIQKKPLYRPDIWVHTGGYAREMLRTVVREAKKRGLVFHVMNEAPSLVEC